METSSKITEINGVGQELKKLFGNIGINTIADLIENYPRRYEDYSNVQSISKIRPGMVTIRANIKQTKGRYARRGIHITEAVASDDSGSVKLVWFNQPYRSASIKRGVQYYISGDFELRRQRFCIQNPSIELVSNFPLSTARIVPVYRETKGLKSAQIGRVLKEILPLIRETKETLPEWILRGNNLLPKAAAIEMIHFPVSTTILAKAERRIGFEEIFELTLASLLNKYELAREMSIRVPFDEVAARTFVKNLPFKLTDSQRRAIWQIFLDMDKEQPMNRLLEGDVGSGKTVVATMAAMMVVRNSFQVALLAPTEILARQHAETVTDLLSPLGLSAGVRLLVGGLSGSKKQRIYDDIKTGRASFIIGTHALLQEKVNMQRLGLIIVDEQHRFGVDQRRALQKKAGHMPHVLNMTATPIPRSLALTLYGEMDISVMSSKPGGRLPVVTRIVSPNSRQQLYQDIDRELEAGRQMFVVTPLIDGSGDTDDKSVKDVYESLTKGVYRHRRVGLLHGKMKPKEKESVMNMFAIKKLDILVSTTVIEVGVNIPNATVMLIENADRFGLAQIHQLRGRVGRSNFQGYCYLMMSDSSTPSRRLRALEQMNDGFKLAELDLEIRGPGAIYGTLQHGELDLRIAKLSDTKLIAASRRSAQEFIDRGENLLEYKQLKERVQGIRAITNLN